MEPAPLLAVDALHVELNDRKRVVRPVDGVSFTVLPGETLGVVGESGCGKTMTVMAITGLLPPNARVVSGSIKLDGRDLTKLEPASMRSVRGGDVGVVFQDPMTSLNPTMRIGRQIAEGVTVHRRVSSTAASARATELLEMVGIPNARERFGSYPHELSGGMRQRVMIAIALAAEPRLLIADEPTTALDVTIQRQILDLLDSLRKELGMAVILVTHDFGVIAGLADRTVVMYAGRIVEQGDVESLFSRPRHRYTAALFAAQPTRSDGSTRSLASIVGQPPDLARTFVGCRFSPRCGFAEPRCIDQEPPVQFESAGHTYACWNPSDSGNTVPSTSRGSDVESRRPPARVMVTAHEVTKNYPLRQGVFGRHGVISALSEVSLQVVEGKTLGLVGESGCGKTTFARIVAGLEQPTSGSVQFELTEANDRRARARTVQYMFQDPYSSLDPRMRVGAILREPLAIHGVGTYSEQRAKVAELLTSVGLPVGSVNRYIHEFSGGQRQRIGLARALALDPRLIVADEPVSALDVSVRSTDSQPHAGAATRARADLHIHLT